MQQVNLGILISFLIIRVQIICSGEHVSTFSVYIHTCTCIYIHTFIYIYILVYTLSVK
jgi:hypothetical protein